MHAEVIGVHNPTSVTQQRFSDSILGRKYLLMLHRSIVLILFICLNEDVHKIKVTCDIFLVIRVPRF